MASNRETLTLFKERIEKLAIKLLEKYGTRKQKVCMCAGIVNPRGLSVYSISSRLDIMSNNLNNFPFTEKNSEERILDLHGHHSFFMSQEHGSDRLKTEIKI